MGDRKFHFETTRPKFPWYKERLLTECLKDPRNRPSLDSSYWRFLEVGLDDFRDGYPTPAIETPSEPQHGTSPLIFSGRSSTSYALDKGRRTKCLSKQQACFSKQHVQQQIRRQRVADVEEKLKQHPLVRCPHFEQCMAPELFDQVISILDPNMSVNRASSAPTPEYGEEKKEVNCTDPEEESVEEVDRLENGVSVISEINPEIQRRSPKNPYVRLQLHENGQDQGVHNNTGLRSPSQDEDVTKATKLLCDWANPLGEETNITESATLEPFARDFEKKKSLSFPIQTINTNNLSDELCDTASAQVGIPFHPVPTLRTRQPGTKKPIYGAWYLDPKTWKKRNAGEVLQDPDVLPEEFEFQNRTSEKDEELKELHGTHAFKQFIISKGLKAPKFLSSLFPEEEPEPQARGGSSTPGSAATRKTVTRSASKQMFHKVHLK